jgi:FixJ family two-component response regulator
VIMITGRTYPDLDAQVSAAGAYGPLAKPFAAATLLDSIHDVIARCDKGTCEGDRG